MREDAGYYVFEDAKFGGTLHIPYTDDDGASQGDWKLKLANQVGPAAQGGSLKFIWTERKLDDSDTTEAAADL